MLPAESRFGTDSAATYAAADTASPAAAAAPSAMQRPVACIGHRGLPLLYPENTVPSFRAALDAGADGIELDIRLTRDNEVVVLHDTTLDRSTTATGPVSALTLAELRRVLARSTNLGLHECFPNDSADASQSTTGSFVPPSSTNPHLLQQQHVQPSQLLPVLYAPVPRLADVFDLLLTYQSRMRSSASNGRVPHPPTCVIDVKWDNSISILMQLQRVLEIPAYAPLLPNIMLGVWSFPFALAVRALVGMPVRRMYICESLRQAKVMAYFADCVSLDKNVILKNPSIVEYMRSRKCRLAAWTTDCVSEVADLVRLGVDDLIGDCVPLCMAVVNNDGEHIARASSAYTSSTGLSLSEQTANRQTREHLPGALLTSSDLPRSMSSSIGSARLDSSAKQNGGDQITSKLFRLQNSTFGETNAAGNAIYPTLNGVSQTQPPCATTPTVVDQGAALCSAELASPEVETPALASGTTA